MSINGTPGEPIGSFYSPNAADEGCPGSSEPPPDRNFLVFSLPRSRSSWLSVFLTTGFAICLHDYSAYGKSLPTNLFQCSYIGMASTGAAGEWEHWVNKYPSAPLVVINRSPRECAASFCEVMQLKLNTVMPGMLDLNERLRQISALPQTLTVEFGDIDARAAEIYEHCLPGQFLDRRRLDELLQMQIEPVPQKMRAESARLEALGWPRHD